MNIRTVGATAGVGLLVALSTALPATARGGPQTSLEEMLPVLATSQGPSDRIPAAVDLAELGNPSPSSTRFLGSDGTADYWVARIGGSQVCLILYVALRKRGCSRVLSVGGASVTG